MCQIDKIDNDKNLPIFKKLYTRYRSLDRSSINDF